MQRGKHWGRARWRRGGDRSAARPGRGGSRGDEILAGSVGGDYSRCMTAPSRNPFLFGRAAWLLGALLILLPASNFNAGAAGAGWWKGNLHTHSLWSDGDDYPESIARWYKEHGCHFLMFTDHNVLSAGERWIDVEKNKGGRGAFENYLKRFGAEWVETRTDKNGRKQVRLRGLAEFRSLFEERNRFLLIQGEEITARFLPGPGRRSLPVHVNATNLKELVIPQSGSSVAEVLRKNVDAVVEQRERTGQPMFPHLNHPNFFYAVTAEDLMKIANERFFEVYNGHPSVHNEGDETYAGTERMWDIINAFRLGELGLEPLYGLATDDGHSYHEFNSGKSNPGRGWVMVRAPRLIANGIVEAMEAGRFYSSSGVVLKDVKRSRKGLSLRIEGDSGVTYTTRFIGTRKGFDRASKPVLDKDGKELRATRRYSRDIGVVLKEVAGLKADYNFKGDELYVRAVITSSKKKENPYRKGEFETAWTQPVVVAE